MFAAFIAGADRFPNGGIFGSFAEMEVRTADTLVLFAPRPPVPLKFALVGIDANSLQVADKVTPDEIAASPALRAMCSPYPWSRVVYAEALERILGAGARVVLVDILMTVPRDGDDALRAVLEKYRDRIVLVSDFTEEAAQHGVGIISFQMPSESLLPPGGVPTGYANFGRDFDHVVRSAELHMSAGGGEDADSAAFTVLKLLAPGAWLDSLPANFYFRRAKVFNEGDVIPLWQLFPAATWDHNLKGGEVFRDRVVALGAFTPSFHDEFQTPFGSIPGIALHCNVIAAAWKHAYYLEPSLGESLLGALFGAVVAGLVSFYFPKTLIRVLILLAAFPVLSFASIAFITAWRWMPPLFDAGGCLYLAAIGCIVSDFTMERRERRRTRQTLERYVSPDVARHVLDHRTEYLQALGGVRRDVTILFSDIRGFTSLSEKAEAGEVLTQLNDYLGRMVDAIFSSGGSVDKFLGDGIMAVWGNITNNGAENDAASAVECVRQMYARLTELNKERVAAGLKEWHMGAGIHSGTVVFGNIGSVKKMEPTIIGDTVNLASRTEGLTKQYKLELLITDATQRLIPNVRFRAVDRTRVVGRSKPIGLYTHWSEAFDEAAREEYDRGLDCYREGRFEEAAGIFEGLLFRHPGDSLCKLYAGRCRAFAENPPSLPWDGVFEAVSK